MKKIFTYFEPISQLNYSDELSLIKLWRANWEAHGWETKVVNEFNASKHPLYQMYMEAIVKLPSVNPGRYDQHCMLRWLAVANELENEHVAVMSDYDVMSYGFEPIKTDMTKMSLYQRHVPALVSGSRWAFEKTAEKMMNYEMRPEDTHNGRPHTSDMHIIERSIRVYPQDFEVEHLVRNYLEEDWDKALAVHYCNATMGPTDKKPRHVYIPRLRPI